LVPATTGAVAYKRSPIYLLENADVMFFCSISDAVWRRILNVPLAGNVGDGGQGDHAYDVETSRTVIYAVGFTGQLFDVVVSVGISYERCNDRAQDLNHVPIRKKHSERPTANLVAADMDIPRSHLETTRQRYITLCNELDKVNLLGMSYPLLAVLNIVDFLKY